MRLSPIREFGLKAVLWLPMAFFLWFVLSSPLVWPVIQLAKLALLSIWPNLYAEVIQNGHTMDVVTRVLVNQAGPDGRSGVGELVLTQNPLIYGYSLPLFSGLAMATPIGGWRRTLHFAIALSVIWLTQAFGVVCESLKVLGFDSGAAGANAVTAAGLQPDAIALAYQFGYLILPAVVPIALWLGLNRDFIEALVHPSEEPEGGSAGHKLDVQE
ncbi:exosortase H-associated membrane protein [Dokdonella sp. MW10]|uniref:exosortase H-associated membrane protein n=1 Tax=Dokdonella sp. MW10 TaxID=2992926 RepID=UPI003F812A28